MQTGAYPAFAQPHGKESLEKAKEILQDEYNGPGGTKTAERAARRADMDACITARGKADLVKEAIANNAETSYALTRYKAFTEYSYLSHHVCRWIETGEMNYLGSGPAEVLNLLVIERLKRLGMGLHKHGLFVMPMQTERALGSIMERIKIVDADDAVNRKNELDALLKPSGLCNFEPMQDIYAVFIEVGPITGSLQDERTQLLERYGIPQHLHSADRVLK